MKEGNENPMITDYLKRPYARMVVPEQDGSFRAEIQEFPGCIALADTAAEAYASLEEVAAAWIDAALAKGQGIPEPTEDSGFSGKFVLRLPKSLHRKAAFGAQREQVSLNQFIVSILAEQIGAKASAAASWATHPVSMVWLQQTSSLLPFVGNLVGAGPMLLAPGGASTGPWPEISFKQSAQEATSANQ
jgi:antitoxin HicB